MHNYPFNNLLPQKKENNYLYFVIGAHSLTFKNDTENTNQG